MDEPPVLVANNAPRFVGIPSNYRIGENREFVGSIRASDRDSQDSITGYRVSDGDDRLLFEINSLGTLSFKVAPDYENPSDNGGNNWYDVVVEATSGVGSRELIATKRITIEVTNVVETVVPKPDLILNRIHVSTDPVVIGFTVTASVTIRNEGAATARNFETKLYLVQDGDPQTLYLGRIRTSSLDADDGTTVTFATALPSNKGIVPSGAHYWFLAKVDPDDIVEESDDHPPYHNNITTRKMAIYAACSSDEGTQCSTYMPCCTDQGVSCIGGSCTYDEDDPW